ncbi:MAG: YwiC-like family protein [Chloroflexota bacterium]
MRRNTLASLFKRHIALPQDHGSWVFILSPLLVGLFAGERFTPASVNLIVAAMGAFLLRQPVSMAVKAYSGRRSRDDLPAARFWMLAYGMLILLALAGLIAEGFTFVLLLAIPGLPVFGWHLWLVSRRAERRQAGVEILATGALALAAPAAFWIGREAYDPLGWALWLGAWLQSAASIVYAYLRLGQREMRVGEERPENGKQAAGPGRSALWRMGGRAFAYTSFNLALALVLGWAAILPRWIFVPYLLQWAETLWGISRPAIGWKPVKIGVRQLVVSALWTALFIITWRL